MARRIVGVEGALVAANTKLTQRHVDAIDAEARRTHGSRAAVIRRIVAEWADGRVGEPAH